MNEATSIAARLGIDLPFMSGVMEVSSGRNSATQSFAGFRDLQAANTAEPDVTKRLLAILRKDMKLGKFLAAELDVSTPILDAVSKATDELADDDLVARWRALSEAMSNQ
jgi:3-hydroxyisobutyrate dehydrogenase-like beta-hydroxyacid dehydrogenase